MIGFLQGEHNNRGDHANRLSLVVAIKFGEQSILLPGDLEAKSTTRYGWAGMLEALDAQDELGWLTDLDLIKLPHHGSKNAVHAAAWALHGNSRRVPWAVVTPYNRGQNPPPHREALEVVRGHTERLGASVGLPKVVAAIESSGWTETGGPGLGSEWPGLVATIPRQGPIDVQRFDPALLYQ